MPYVKQTAQEPYLLETDKHIEGNEGYLEALSKITNLFNWYFVVHGVQILTMNHHFSEYSQWEALLIQLSTSFLRCPGYSFLNDVRA